MENNKKKCYKYCFVPKCTNTTVSKQKKIFFHVPREPRLRNKWCAVARRDKISNKSTVYCCEDHFKLEDDMANFMYYKITGHSSRLQLKPGVLPHIFDCQVDRVNAHASTSRSVLLKLSQKKDVAIAIASSGIPVQGSESTESTDDSQEDGQLHNISELSTTLTVAFKKDQSCQVNLKPKFRSVGIGCCIKTKNALVSPIKLGTRTVKTSPMKFTKRSMKHGIQQIQKIMDESSQDISSSESEISDYGNDTKSDDGEIEECFAQYSKTSCRHVTVSLIHQDPRLYLGILKECIFIVDVLSRHTQIPVDHVLLCLKKIRNNPQFKLLGLEFGVATSSVSKIFSKSIPAIANCLRELIITPSLKEVQRCLPIPFRARFKKVQYIIDCLEIEIEKPSNPVHQALTWSDYKKCNTVKYLISCTPDGLVNFISCGYGGRCSDATIIEECGFLDILTPGAHVMADRGFKHIEQVLNNQGCMLVRPPSVSEKERMDKVKVRQAKRIASLRIHIERVISRIREFKFLAPHSCINTNLVRLTDSIIIIVCGLINMQGCLIK